MLLVRLLSFGRVEFVDLRPLRSSLSLLSSGKTVTGVMVSLVSRGLSRLVFVAEEGLRVRSLRPNFWDPALMSARICLASLAEGLWKK